MSLFPSSLDHTTRMAETRRVSVVIPTYNRAEYLGDALRSALVQPETGEVIVVDDGSTDGTKEVLKSFPDVNVISTANVERGAARNLGAHEAQFDLLAFLDSDDAWEPGKLAAQLRRPDEPSVTGVRFVDAGGAPSGRTYTPPGDAWLRLPFENLFLAAPSSLLMPASVFLAAGGFPEERKVQGSEDWVFLNRLRKMGAHIAVIPELLIRYRVHSGNSTGQLDKVAGCLWSAAEIIGRSTGSEEMSRRVKGRTAGSISRQFARAGRWGDARRWFRISLLEGTPRETIWTTWAVATSGVKSLLSRGNPR